MKKVFVLLLGVTVISVSYAQTNTYQGEIDNFFALLEKGDPKEAINSIYSTNPWVKNIPDAIHNINQQLSGLLEMVGEYCGKEYLCESNLNDRFIDVLYVVYYDRQPIRMQFQFYKPKDEWRLNNFTFDPDFNYDIAEMTRSKLTVY